MIHKRKIEIFERIASQKMSIFNLESFRKTFPRLFDVILYSMDAWAKESIDNITIGNNLIPKNLKSELESFNDWLGTNQWKYVPNLQKWFKRTSTGMGEYKTTQELYLIYKEESR